MAAASDSLTAKKQETFLARLRESGNVTAAARRARISRETAYHWRHEDTDFAAAWEAALDRGTDGLEDEARRRAFEGTRKPVYQAGKLAGYVREYSDTLLIFLLKAHRPEKYRETTRHEHSGPRGGPIAVQEVVVNHPDALDAE